MQDQAVTRTELLQPQTNSKKVKALYVEVEDEAITLETKKKWGCGSCDTLSVFQLVSRNSLYYINWFEFFLSNLPTL